MPSPTSRQLVDSDFAGDIVNRKGTVGLIEGSCYVPLKKERKKERKQSVSFGTLWSCIVPLSFKPKPSNVFCSQLIPCNLSTAQTVIALEPTASRAGRERPRTPAMTLVVGTRFKVHHSDVAGESTVRPLPLHRAPRWVLHRDIFQSEHRCRAPRQ